MHKPTAALRTLSEIVISANVGVIHLRRVGELLVARAELSNRILYSDRKINVLMNSSLISCSEPLPSSNPM
ncbi:hypothetical protein GCM10020229_13600 [Kitasatospora albolonga]